MTLYKADFLDLVSKPASKAKGKKKSEPVEEAVEGAASVPTVSEEKVKKPRTEKQLAALERMKEARKRKREEAEAEKVAEQEAITKKQSEIALKEKEIAEKKALQAEKRRLKREAKKAEVQESTPSNTSAEVDQAVEELMEEKPKVKKAKKTKTVAVNTLNEPPIWFQKYVEGVNKEQNLLNREKKPAKQVKIESQEVAAKSWNDGLTRDRVQQEVDGHMGRMYNMMFGARKIL